MEAAARQLAQGNVAGDADFFGGRWVAGQAQAVTDGAFVHAPAFAEGHVFAVTKVRHTQHFDVFEHIAHHRGIDNGHAVVRKANRPGSNQLAHGAQLFAGSADGGGGDGQYFGVVGFFGSAFDVFDDGDTVGSGAGVGHTGDHCEPTGGCGARACGDGFFVLFTRFAQMHVKVNQARADDAPSGVDDCRPGGSAHPCVGGQDPLIPSNDDAVIDQ